MGLDLVFDRAGYELSMERYSLRISFENRLLERVSLRFLDSVTFHARTRLDTSLLSRLAEAGVAVCVLNRKRDAAVPLWLGNAQEVAIRRCQYRAHEEPGVRLGLARHLVIRKLTVACALVRTLEQITQVPWPIFGKDELDALMGDVSAADDINALLGVEGYAARQWFSAVGRQVEDHWGFKGRNRRPPRDPVNALLSLCYSLALARVTQSVRQRGLDPALGYLHAPEPGRPSLALDLLEPWRPLIDGFVMTHLMEFRQDDFNQSDSGCFLKKQARGRFFGLWSEWCDQPLLHGFDENTLMFQPHFDADRDGSLGSLSYQSARSFAALLKTADQSGCGDWLEWYETEAGQHAEAPETHLLWR